MSVGVYDANPNYLTTSDPSIYFLPGIPASNPATGLLVPVELTWTPERPPVRDLEIWRLVRQCVDD